MGPTQAVGIDLGTTYSCISYLNEHGEPVTLHNQEGELSTPSVVLFEGDEPVVGTEALRNAVRHPERVVQNSKRHMGDPETRWPIDGKPFTPVDIAALILKKLLSAAQEQIGVITQAVVTVPAQFSDAQRHATIEAGHRAGLERVDLINEPVAAALCHVLGQEGMWFSELARDQRILVYDLGGGTFDLSMVAYRKNEVSVIASSGDLHLGGIDWNEALQRTVCKQFFDKYGLDPREDRESMQSLALEVEQTKRSLSVRPRAALTCQHAGKRETFQVQLEEFEKLTRPLVERTAGITEQLVKQSGRGWAEVDVVLTTGGASRMPMIRSRLKKMSGTTLNTSLSPDLSIAHGATYYAGMLLSNNRFARSILNPRASSRLSKVRQFSVNARALGILVRDTETNTRIPYYMIGANTTLPASVTQNFGTVVENQKRVNLHVVESGISPEKPPAKLGTCVIEDLPPNLPEGSEIAVTIRYDEQARVHVSARDVASGKQATTEIIRQENLLKQLQSDTGEKTDLATPAEKKRAEKPSKPPAHAATRQHAKPAAGSKPPGATPAKAAAPRRETARAAVQERRPSSSSRLEESERPIPLCNKCGEPLTARGVCPQCGTRQKQTIAAVSPRAVRQKTKSPGGQPTPKKPARGAADEVTRQTPPPPPPANQASRTKSTDEEDSIDLGDLDEPSTETPDGPSRRRSREERSGFLGRKGVRRKRSSKSQGSAENDVEQGEEDFWNLTD